MAEFKYDKRERLGDFLRMVEIAKHCLKTKEFHGYFGGSFKEATLRLPADGGRNIHIDLFIFKAYLKFRNKFLKICDDNEREKVYLMETMLYDVAAEWPFYMQDKLLVLPSKSGNYENRQTIKRKAREEGEDPNAGCFPVLKEPIEGVDLDTLF